MANTKILFANVPIDGHFNPLSGLAVHLKNQGYDVRWYAGKAFSEKLKKFDIPHFPFDKAKEVNQFNIDHVFPERKKLKSGVPQLKFDLKHVFVYRAPEYFEDIQKIHQAFPFELMICDAAFTAGTIVMHKMNVPVVALGIIPLMETSKDLAPYGLGITPQQSFPGKAKQSFMRFMAKNMLFKESLNEFNTIITSFNLEAYDVPVLFDIPPRKASIFLQSGVPGFEYKRSDLSEKIRFVGALNDHKESGKNSNTEYPWKEKLNQYKKIILLSQGTFEADATKLIIPTLEAFKGSEFLVIVTTGKHNTEELRKQYPEDNIVIEDFLDYGFIMPKAHVYITNGGYGGALLSIEHELPMVAAGINEGKNEICARIGFFNIGIDLKTERPSSAQIKKAAEEVIHNASYKKNVEQLSKEFKAYDTFALCEKYIQELLPVASLQ